MGELEFFLAFICPWILLGLILLFKRNEPIRAIISGLLSISFFMVVVAGPFTQMLASKDLLTYEPSSSVFMLYRLPVEIYFGLFCKAFLVGIVLYFCRPKIHRITVPSRIVRMGGSLVFVMLGLLGVIMLRDDVTMHLGLVFVWAGPLLFLEWLAGSSVVWRTKNMFSLAVVISTLYLSLAEGVALRSGLWRVDPGRSLGIDLFGVALERVCFIFFFCLIACQALEIFWRHVQKSRLFSQKDY